jgi:aerobic carbon-monoxide dehydrogenase medium subunit
VKASPFAYHDPRTRAELLGLVATLDNAKLLAGGQSLMPMINLRLAAPDHLVDINRIADLAGVRISGDSVEIGAMTRQADLQKSAALASVAPIFRAALDHVGHFQTRSRGTIGGSCCHLDPAAELPALCALLDAEFDVVGPGGERRVQARDWFRGYLESALDEREILQSIRWRAWAPGHGFGFSEYARRRGDFAVGGSGALLEFNADRSIRRAAIVLFGVAPSPVRLGVSEQALVGRRLDDAALASVVDEAQKVEAMGDVHVSADYRRRIAGVVVRRALQDAARGAEAAA